MMLDERDDTILVMHFEKTPSIQEIADKIGRSVGATYDRLKSLEQQGLLNQAAGGKHRSRSITPAGRDYLEKNRLVGA